MFAAPLCSWLKHGKGNRQDRRESRRKSSLRRCSYVPRLDALEDRTLPSTFTVLNLFDEGSGSLRQAVAGANANPGFDVIDFDPKLHGVIALTSGQLTITDHLLVDGPGANLMTVSGSDASRVFQVEKGVFALLEGMTISHGRAESGGGVWNAGYLTLLNVVVSHNQAIGNTSNASGGGIFNAADGTLYITDSTIADNLAHGDPDVASSPRHYGGRGGGLYNEGAASVTRSRFERNLARSAAGNDFAIGGFGGGIWNGTLGEERGEATLTVSHSTFLGNRTLGGPGGSALRGGFAEGAGIFNINAYLTLTHSAFADNQAVAGTSGQLGGNSNGGGIVIFRTSTATITDCNFTGNQIVAGQSSLRGGAANGAAMAINGPNAVVTISRSTFDGNQATGGAGGEGAPGFQGTAGGIFVSQSTMTITDSTFTGNQAVGGQGGAGANGGTGFGGALIILGAVEPTTVTISGSTFHGNQATGGAAGSGGRGGFAIGGGMDINGPATVTITDSTVSQNRALGAPSSGGQAASVAQAGGIRLAFGPATLNISNSTISGNQAIGGIAGVGGSGNPDSAQGGGILIQNAGSSANIAHSTISGNLALAGAGGAGGNGGGAAGGGFWVNAGAALAVTDSLITDNQAVGGRGNSGGAGRGGGLTIFNNTTVDLARVTIRGNQVTGGESVTGDGGAALGGGVYTEGTTVCLHDSLVTENSAQGGAAGTSGQIGNGWGGGIFVQPGSTVGAIRTPISGNSASTSDPNVFGVLTAHVESVLVNDGHPQRSSISSLTVTFSGVVTLEPGAFAVTRADGSPVEFFVTTLVVDGKTVATITFTGEGLEGYSLADGSYTLLIRGDRIRDSLGRFLDGDADCLPGGNHYDEFFRLYGDSDGDGDVDLVDLMSFFGAYGRAADDPAYLWFFDVNGDGQIALADAIAFMSRYGTRIEP